MRLRTCPTPWYLAGRSRVSEGTPCALPGRYPHQSASSRGRARRWIGLLVTGQVLARVHITGGSGTGKTTLARRIGALLDAPVYHLDDVAREAGTGRVRPVDERIAIVSLIALKPRWVTDGIQVGWTDDLCREADVIVWLDQLSWPAALARVLRRFAAGGLSEIRSQGGLRGIFRPRSQARQLLELYRASREIRAFHRAPLDPAAGDGGSHAATAAQLTAFAAKVVHCRSRADIEKFVATLRGQVGDRPNS